MKGDHANGCTAVSPSTSQFEDKVALPPVHRDIRCPLWKIHPRAMMRLVGECPTCVLGTRKSRLRGCASAADFQAARVLVLVCISPLHEVLENYLVRSEPFGNLSEGSVLQAVVPSPFHLKEKAF